MSSSIPYFNGPSSHNNISSRPNLTGTIPVDTAPPAQNTSTIPGQPNDVAGVLRRNQACLACRRRKLKCDAVRPHCSTCVRSHRHLLRTAPNTRPVLSCEYDDSIDAGTATGPNSTTGAASSTANGGRSSVRMGSAGDEPNASASTGGDDEDDEAKKKKRKSSGGRKKRDDEVDDERERLNRRIEELEQALAKKSLGPSSSTSSDAGTTSVPDPIPGRWTAPFNVAQTGSPTAFLEMLSSAASNAASAAAQAPPAVPGLRSGASESTMFSAVTPHWISADRSEPTGLTPMFQFNSDPPPPLVESTSSRPSTTQTSPFNLSAESPAVPGILSPNNVFNFSPAPSGPGIQWPPPLVDGHIEPSKETQGPWRGVDTVSSVFGVHGISSGTADPSAATANGNGFSQSIEIDVSMSGMVVDDAMQNQLLMDLFWPGWPPNLPEPPVVNALIDAFFDLVPNLPRLLHRARFLARMTLPPTHSNFPHPALIHAMCAVAASWCSPSLYQQPGDINRFDTDKCLPNGTPKEPSMTFALEQTSFAKDAVQDGLNTGNRLFDVVRAMIILCRVFIDDTRMLECWAYCGLVARMILPLGLNVRSAELSLKSVMLPPPADALEREERRAVVWMAMYHDTVASSASGWGTSISLDELTVPLPVSRKDFDMGLENMDSNPQDIESLDLFIKHPVVDSFVMALKAAMLLNRVNKFARKWKNRRLRDDDDLDGLQRPEFRELANAIACLQMSFPPSLRNPCQINAKKQLDVDLISAHLLPQAAIICLYEPFADVTDPNDQPARRIINAAQAVIGVIQQLASIVPDGVSNLSTIMHSSSSIALVTAARTCLLFYRHALNVNDHVQAESYRMDIEMARVALAQYGLKMKIGYHHSQLIEYFLDRATNPTFEKLQAHYPEHPRPGALDLHTDSHFGMCVLNALNIKRGFWRLKGDQGALAAAMQSASSVGVSPMGSTPESASGSVNSAGFSGPSHRNSFVTDSPSANPPSLSGSVSSGPSYQSGSSGSAGPKSGDDYLPFPFLDITDQRDPAITAASVAAGQEQRAQQKQQKQQQPQKKQQEQPKFSESLLTPHMEALIDMRGQLVDGQLQAYPYTVVNMSQFELVDE